MDNLSHSVVGLGTGELIHRLLPEESDAAHNSLRRRLLLTACWLASNFADLDLVLTPLLPAPLGYLLHHRGHTHTLLYALPQAMLVCLLFLLLWPAARRLLKSSGTVRLGLALALGAGFGLHLAMDYLNSYGIHPWHPFDSRWFYGDMVFILEPVFWIAWGIPLALMLPRRWLRGTVVLLFAGMLIYFTFTGHLLWPSLAGLLAVAFAAGAAQRRAGPRGTQALVLAALISIGFIGAQHVASARAMQMVAQHLHSQDPDSRLLDAAMTAFPANSLCWNFVSVESKESAGIYRLRRGMLSLGPAWLPAAACPSRFAERTPDDATAAIALFGKAEGELRTLRDLVDTNCVFAAWLRFARAPFFADGEAADMRFAATPRGNFTTLRLHDFAGSACPRDVPGWGMPRADLLETPSKISSIGN